MPSQHIAVIGGGAKGAAIAAKAACLRACRVADVDVTLFEKAAVGAHWDGAHGFTDGRQPLCTPAERDLGFPYDVASYGADVAAAMQAHYSWMAHLVRGEGELDYAGWVNRRSPRPRHGEFAAYLRDAVKRSGSNVVLGDCTGLAHDGRQWAVSYTDKSGGVTRRQGGFDGVVVTSPGSQIPIGKLADRRLFSGEDFWARLPAADAIARKREGPIVIIGAGGTAAAIAAWFVGHGFADSELIIVADRPTLYTRTHNFFESRLFSDEDAWEALDDAQRSEFNLRLTRGVVWDSVSEILESARELSFRVGRVDDIRLGDDHGDGTEPEIIVMLKERPTQPALEIPAALIVNACGFDPWWFRDLLAPPLRSQVHKSAASFVSGMGRDLSLPIPDAPGLHVPFLAGAIGPGFTSLMVLGAMADRILAPYAARAPGGA